MNIVTRNFGEVEFTEDRIINFKEGIPGFREYTKYIIIEEEENSFAHLQSIEDGNLSFIVINPYILKKDYSIDIKDQYVEMLGGGGPENFSVYVVTAIIDKVEDATVNLIAPIIIQNETREGMQVILENTKYTTKHKIVDLLKEGGC
ncbi:flagellar assembly protein FliW [Cellulosilyticum ruminicola]|uniref:flagellar assembly protein FliW n=1 Tax=Cellulosilyticum ruminicola TaxID=425254 RepID=UPI0006D09F06|nr:flagellar assembly protein FliW [Cellulosilyticum ruminicola]